MNWKQIITEIINRGFTQREIAEEAGVVPSVISDLASGRHKDIRWTAGDALLFMHRRTEYEKAKQESSTP